MSGKDSADASFSTASLGALLMEFSPKRLSLSESKACACADKLRKQEKIRTKKVVRTRIGRQHSMSFKIFFEKRRAQVSSVCIFLRAQIVCMEDFVCAGLPVNLSPGNSR